MKEHLRITWAHIRRSPYQTLAAIGIMTITFFVIGITALVAAGSQTVLRWFETRPQVTVWLEDEITAEQIDNLKAELNQGGRVKEIRYVSKEEALAIYREDNKDDPLLLEMVTANILPASLEIAATDIIHLPEIAQSLQGESGVAEIDFQKEVVETMKTWTGALRRVGLGLIIFLTIESFLIILIIVGMKVAIRREEIEILRLIGASGGYVSAPFIFEGIFYGLMGAVLAWGIIYLLLLYATPILVQFLTSVPLLPVPIVFMLGLLGAQILGGIFIGIFSSFLAVRRYLR